MPIDLREVARLRLRNQRVTGARFAAAQDVVGWLGAVQSQEYALAKWTLGARMAGVVHDTDVEQAVARGEILRTHILRPTWHFVTPADLRWMTRLTGPRILSGSAHRLRFLELDAAQISAALEVITRALEGGRQLTRLELQAVLERAGLNPTGPRMTYIGMHAEMAPLIASGAPRDGKQTFALLDEVAPLTDRDRERFDRDRALADLTLRYFTSHGPATIPDFTWWCGVNGADTKRGIAANGSSLEQLDVAGEKFWWAGDKGESADPPAAPDIHLMQAYDEFVVAYKSPRTPVDVDGLASPQVLRPPPFFHHVVIDAQVAGYWRRPTAGDDLRVEVSLLRPLTGTEREALAAEVARYSDFLERPVSLAAASA